MDDDDGFVVVMIVVAAVVEMTMLPTWRQYRPELLANLCRICLDDNQQ